MADDRNYKIVYTPHATMSTVGRLFVIFLIIAVGLTGSVLEISGQTAAKQGTKSSAAQETLDGATKQAVPASAAPDTSTSEAQKTHIDPPQETGPAPDQPPESVPILPSPAVAELEKRFEKIAAGIHSGQLNHKAADQFYQELNDILSKTRNRLWQALTSADAPEPLLDKAPVEKDASRLPETVPAPGEKQEPHPPEKTPEDHGAAALTADQLRIDLNALYKLRLNTLALVSPEFRAQVTGTGAAGLQAFREELDYLAIRFRDHLESMTQVGMKTIDNAVRDPIHAIPLLLQIVLALLIFIWWRRWAAQGIDRVRGYLLDIRPRKPRHKRTAKALWYLNRVRRPIEWLIFLTLLWRITGPHEEVFYILLWTQFRYVLIAWLMVSLINAITERGTAGMKSEAARLKLRTVWLIFIWVLFVAIGVDVITDLAGKGALYAWFQTVSVTLVVPVLLLLIHWWRPAIYESLDDDLQHPAFIKNLLQNRRGPGSYMGAALGGVYLIWDSGRQWLLRGITNFEWGRHLIANLTRIEAVRLSERRQRQRTYEPISAEVRDRLYSCEGSLVESAGLDILERMEHLVDLTHRGEAIIVAERGGGKSQLLERLDDRLGHQMILFDCPPGGVDAFYQAFAEILELDAVDLTSENLENSLQSRRVKAVGIDNLHRLSRPAMGGQQEIDRLSEMIRAIDADVFWFYGIDWAAWQYFSLIRADRMIVDEVLNLPLWTEDQIRELIEMRSAQAGVNPDFRELTLPRQFVDLDYETIEERNQSGFYRILWNAADGNPAVALQLWANSLRVAPDGRILALLPQLPPTQTLERSNINVLLILRVIAQSGYANKAQIADSLKMPGQEVSVALRFALAREWVELADGWYRLTWKWFRTITRVLARQNLLVRRTL